MVNKKDIRQIEEDLLNETYYEGRREAVLRNDYDEFCDNYAYQIEEMVKAISILKEAHDKYGHSFCCKDWV